ncbi:MAG: hypothetical protein SH857_17100 [Chitinophagales bacterium]|nr:hypothetical protein [Chitinophagales bacterium]
MKYTLFYKPSTAKELLRLPAKDAFKVRAAINNLTGNPRPSGCKKLEGSYNE